MNKTMKERYKFLVIISVLISIGILHVGNSYAIADTNTGNVTLTSIPTTLALGPPHIIFVGTVNSTLALNTTTNAIDASMATPPNKNMVYDSSNNILYVADGTNGVRMYNGTSYAYMGLIGLPFGDTVTYLTLDQVDHKLYTTADTGYPPTLDVINTTSNSYFGHVANLTGLNSVGGGKGTYNPGTGKVYLPFGIPTAEPQTQKFVAEINPTTDLVTQFINYTDEPLDQRPYQVVTNGSFIFTSFRNNNGGGGNITSSSPDFFPSPYETIPLDNSGELVWDSEYHGLFPQSGTFVPYFTGLDPQVLPTSDKPGFNGMTIDNSTRMLYVTNGSRIQKIFIDEDLVNAKFNIPSLTTDIIYDPITDKIYTTLNHTGQNKVMIWTPEPADTFTVSHAPGPFTIWLDHPQNFTLTGTPKNKFSGNIFTIWEWASSYGLSLTRNPDPFSLTSPNTNSSIFTIEPNFKTPAQSFCWFFFPISTIWGNSDCIDAIILPAFHTYFSQNTITISAGSNGTRDIIIDGTSGNHDHVDITVSLPDGFTSNLNTTTVELPGNSHNTTPDNGQNSNASSLQVIVDPNVNPGLYLVRATGRSQEHPGISFTGTLYVTVPTPSFGITYMSPSSGQVGTPVRISGTGFTPSHIITVKVNGTNSADSFSTDSLGNFTNQVFTIPAVTKGNNIIMVSDGIHSDTRAFTVTIPAVTNTISGTLHTPSITITPSLHYSTYPGSITATLEELYKNNTLVASKIISKSVSTNTTTALDGLDNVMSGPSSFYMNVTFTDGANQQTVKSNTITSSPYETSQCSPEGFRGHSMGCDLNYTYFRSPDFTKLTTVVHEKTTPFHIELLIINGTFLQAHKWYNYSSVDSVNLTVNVPYNDNVYVAGYGSGLLFSFNSPGNSTKIALGAQVFNASFGAMIGIPAGMFVVVLIASLANQRTGPQYTIITLAVAGILATIGYFVLPPGYWALSLIAGMLGLLVGRKIF